MGATGIPLTTSRSACVNFRLAKRQEWDDINATQVRLWCGIPPPGRQREITPHDRPMINQLMEKPRDLTAAEQQKRRLTAIDDFARELRHRGAEMQPACVENTRTMSCAIALLMRAEGRPLREVRDKTGLSVNTIQRLSWSHRETLESKRAEMGREMAIVADKARMALSERLDILLGSEEELKATRLSDLAVVVGITHDKALALSNQATVVIEHRSGPTIEDVMIEIQAARDRVAAKLKAQSLEAEVVQLPSECPASSC